MREIAAALGVSSVATVAEHLDSLEAMGPHPPPARPGAVGAAHRRGSSVLDRAQAPASRGRGRASVAVIPLLGTIAAGEPIEALAVERRARGPGRARRRADVLRAQGAGASMIDEGIFDGDYVVVEEKPVPRERRNRGRPHRRHARRH